MMQTADLEAILVDNHRPYPEEWHAEVKGNSGLRLGDMPLGVLYLHFMHAVLSDLKLPCFMTSCIGTSLVSAS
jgi:hypothetical protein